MTCSSHAFELAAAFVAPRLPISGAQAAFRPNGAARLVGVRRAIAGFLGLRVCNPGHDDETNDDDQWKTWIAHICCSTNDAEFKPADSTATQARIKLR
jgi:hypothetical protein